MSVQTTFIQPSDGGNTPMMSSGPQACNWCSSGSTFVWHNGLCPRIKAIEYYPDGVTIKRIEFRESL